MKSLWKYAALFAFPLLASPSAASAAAGVVTLGTASNYQTFSDFGQSVALLSDGTYASVWTSWARSFDIQTQWVRPDGTPLLADGGLLVGKADYALASAVVARPAGGAFMAYVRGVATPGIYNPDTDHLQVFVQAYDAAGNPLWQVGGVPAMDVAPAHVQEDFQLVPAPEGGVYVCAEEDVFDPTYGRLSSLSDIRCQRLGAGGERLWTDQGVDAGGQPGLKVIPQLLSDGHGGVLAFWSNLHDPFDHPKDPMSIEGQHLTPQGTKTWGPQGRTLRTAGISAAYSLVSNHILLAVSDGQGGAILSFNDWNGRGPLSLDVYAQRVNGAGRVLWGRGAAAVATGPTQQQNDSLTAAPDGGAFITVWEPNLSAEPVSDRLSLYRLGPDGKVLWKRQLSAPEPGMASSDWGAHGSFDGGLLRLAWNHQPQQGGDEVGPRLIIVDLTGHPRNGPSGAPLGTGGGARILGGLVYDPARKQGFAVWTEDHGAGTDVAGGFFSE